MFVAFKSNCMMPLIRHVCGVAFEADRIFINGTCGDPAVGKAHDGHSRMLVIFMRRKNLSSAKRSNTAAGTRHKL